MKRYIASDKALGVSSAFRKDGNVRQEDDETLSGLLTTESISGDIPGVSKSADPHNPHLRALEQRAELSCGRSLLEAGSLERPSLAGR